VLPVTRVRLTHISSALT